MNKQLDFLTEYPFQYLSDLLKDIKKDPLDVVGLHIGEPKERAPIQALDIICLLYTSPSPRDKRQSRMPSSA